MGRFERLLEKFVGGTATPRPPVSAVIGVSVFDVGYLAVTLPHIVRQSSYPFAERLVVVDPDPQQGARRRERGQPAELERILDDAMAAGTIDRVVTLDTNESRRQIDDRYFASDSTTDLDADRTIFTTLASIDAARNDIVAWFHADALFHTSGDGWVAAGVDALTRDASLWLAMTRGGPPRELPSAPQWLRGLVDRWPRRGRSFSSAHFVCDRRRLYGRLSHASNAGAGRRKHLSDYLMDALERHDAFAGLVPGGWHVRPRTHAPPWAQWIDKLAGAVERGDVPSIQQDGWLHLEQPASRSAWRRHLFPTDTITPRVLHAEARPARIATVVERRKVPGTVPLSVVIPIRNRAGADVRNALASLAWQRSGRPWETILVSHGSDPDFDAELRALAISAGATLVTVGSPTDPWCKPLALNTGLLATDPAIAFVMTMDGDMILADNMIDTILAELRSDPQRIVLCQSSDLPEDCVLPSDPADIRARFEQLRRQATVRGTFGTGGIQAMPRSFAFDVRGYDEDMLWWGALDTDLVRRAEASGLKTSWITDRTTMLHQWHPRKHRVLGEQTQADSAQSSWLRNHELMEERAGNVVRNPSGWGATISDPET